MKVKQKDIEKLKLHLTRMERYITFIELSKRKSDKEAFKLSYKDEKKLYISLHNKLFGKGE